MARLNLAKLRVRLTERRKDKVDSIGVPVSGPVQEQIITGIRFSVIPARGLRPRARNPVIPALRSMDFGFASFARAPE